MQTDPSVFGLVTTLVRLRRLMVALPVTVAVMAVAYGFLTREYVADSRFLPRSANVDASRLTGLAAQFGFNLGGAEAGETIDFYANLLKSRDVLLAAAQSEYRFLPAGRTDSVAGTLIDILGIHGSSSAAVQRAAIGALRGRVVAGTDPQAGMVVLKVVMPYGELAELVNRRLLALVNEFNLQKRQSQAAAERQFTEQRMHDAQHELEQTESDLRTFTERNRIIDSPALRLEASQLQRRVDLRQQVYVTLAQAFEQARIAEVRNTPLLSIVDAPERSAASSVSLKVNAVLGLILGFFLAVAAALGREFVEGQRRERPAEFEELAAAVRRSAPFALWRRLSQRRAYRRWLRTGRPVPPPHFFKQEVVREHAIGRGLRVFVETGTYLGDMLYAVRGLFSAAYSIELSPQLARHARRRFTGAAHVTILEGDSGDVLPTALARIEEPCLFWLDAHYSGGATARGPSFTPILKELAHIAAHRRARSHVVLIDDARLFTGEVYPAMEALAAWAARAMPGHVLEVRDDIIRLLPRGDAAGA